MRLPSTKSPATLAQEYGNSAYDKIVAVNEFREEIERVADVADSLEHYLGAYSTSPTTREDGTDLESGDYYFNSVSDVTYYYSTATSSWVKGIGSADEVTYSGSWKVTEQVDPLLISFVDEIPEYVGTAPEDQGWYLSDKIISGFTVLTSPDINDGEFTEWDMVITLNTPEDEVGVYYALSTEAGYDNFYILLDGVEIFSDSGIYDSVQSVLLNEYAPLNAGVNVITFRYVKDGSSSDGVDAVAITDVTVAYAEVSNYKEDDMVLYGDSLYVCNVAATIEEPSVGTDWTAIASSDDGSGGTDPSTSILSKEVYIDYGIVTDAHVYKFTEATVEDNDTFINRTGTLSFGERGNGKHGRFFEGATSENAMLYSEDFTNAEWSIGAGVTTAFDGSNKAPEETKTVYATLFTLTDNTLDMSITQSGQIGGICSMGLFVKAGNVSQISLIMEDSNGDTLGGTFDIDAETFTSTGTLTEELSGQVEELGNSWYRINLVGNLDQFGSGIYHIGFPDGTANSSYIYIWGASRNANDCPVCAYKRTTDTKVTATAMYDMIPLEGNMPPSTEPFTIVVDIYVEETTASYYSRGIVGLSDVGSQFALSMAEGRLQLHYTSTSAHTIQSEMPVGKSRLVWKYEDGTHSVYINGVFIKSISYTWFELDEWNGMLTIGGQYRGSSTDHTIGDTSGLQGYIRRIDIEHRALTDDEIASLGSYTD